jgi:hypothetical protein
VVQLTGFNQLRSRLDDLGRWQGNSFAKASFSVIKFPIPRQSSPKRESIPSRRKQKCHPDSERHFLNSNDNLYTHHTLPCVPHITHTTHDHCQVSLSLALLSSFFVSNKYAPRRERAPRKLFASSPRALIPPPFHGEKTISILFETLFLRLLIASSSPQEQDERKKGRQRHNTGERRQKKASRRGEGKAESERIPLSRRVCV